jgi:hypothetical protein
MVNCQTAASEHWKYEEMDLGFISTLRFTRKFTEITNYPNVDSMQNRFEC